jgi:protein-tyrosine phosphatase
MKVAEMTDKEWEDQQVAEAQLLWETMNEEDEEINLDLLERPDFGTWDDWAREPLWSEVIEGLWQGGTADHDVQGALKKPMITTKDFDTVITMYAHANPVDWFVKELRYGVWDSNMKDFAVEELFEIVRFAHTEWKAGKKVLIRCQAGWNRSGLITALVLMREGMEAQKAIQVIRKNRSKYALKNSVFAEWLMKEDAQNWKGHTYGTTRRK